MYRAVLPEGQILCERYEESSEGLELYDENDDFIAFVPYANLHAVLDEDVFEQDDRSIM